MSLSIGKKYRLDWQDNNTVYELVSIDLNYAQLRNVKINTFKWSNVEHLVECEG